MIRWERLATAPAPGGAELRLMRRGSEFSIFVGAEELMNSRRGGSETALGEVAGRELASGRSPTVLIGGLGMGFTLRAVLAATGPGARVVVAELVPEVVVWARGPLAEVFEGSLDDPRVEVVTADVATLIGTAAAAYDAVLLDVDNGPDGLVSPANDALYASAGLSAARRALRPGGVLAVWSASRDAAFARRLAAAGFTVREEVARSARGARGARHLIWVARAPHAPRSPG